MPAISRLVARSVPPRKMSQVRSRPTVTSRPAGKVYIAGPSQTVNGGGAASSAGASLTVVVSSGGVE
nr:hypothetical protein [Mycobacterium sp.]